LAKTRQVCPLGLILCQKGLQAPAFALAFSVIKVIQQDSISADRETSSLFPIDILLADIEVSVKQTLEVINQMQADGVIGKYAIGGAVGATFYLEPSATLDVDIFVSLPSVHSGSLLNLEPIYNYLLNRGCRAEAEYIVIGDWPVQFLPPTGDLESEAIDQALQTDVDGVTTWVMRAEYLVAIALQTGRAKDHARILQFLEHNAVNRPKLGELLTKFNLADKWAQFERKYLENANE
jgi:hypothetical protein